MDQPEGEPTNRPAEGAVLEARSWHLAIFFAPNIRLRRDTGLVFARAVANHIDATRVKLGEQEWVFTQPTGDNPNSSVQVSVVPDAVRIEANYPVETQEVFEVHAREVFREFAEQFTPTALIRSAAMIRGQIQIDGDAREFLASHVAHLDPACVAPLERPIHGIGLSLFLPMFAARGADGEQRTDWQLELKIQSLNEDPTKIYIEADASWPHPAQWSNQTPRETADRLQVLNEYVESNVLDFLRRQDDVTE